MTIRDRWADSWLAVVIRCTATIRRLHRENADLRQQLAVERARRLRASEARDFADLVARYHHPAGGAR
jgi:hypothetical protein